MSVINKIMSVYNRRQERRWDEAARAAAINMPPEPWQCERCTAVNSADRDYCSGCGLYAAAIGYWSPIY